MAATGLAPGAALPGSRAADIIRRVTRHPGPIALFRSRTFWAVLALKVVAGSFLASAYLRDLFVPFVNYFVESGFRDPWAYFAALGRTRQFPYPPAMLASLAVPRWLFGRALAPGVWAVTPAHLLVIRLPLIAADVVVAVLLTVWFPQRVRTVIRAYWCSPLVFYTQYWHGQLDLLPTAVLMVSLYALRKRYFAASAAILGVALATKSHLWVAVPFLAVYLQRQVGWGRTALLVALQLSACLAIQAPYLPSPAFLRMVYGSEEQLRVLSFRIPLGGDGPEILLAPLALALLFLRFEQYPKANWDLVMAYLGIVFCVFVMLAPPRPGYVLWSLPFIVYYFCRQGERRLTALNLFTLAYLAFFLTGPESDLVDAWRLAAPGWAIAPPAAWLEGNLRSGAFSAPRNLAFAAMFASMAAILISMYLIGVRSNHIYRMRTRPILIGMAGDSGAGKDVVCGLLRSVMGPGRCLVISGDDYHRWPRDHEMWLVHTHLDVRANDLLAQQDHAVAISQGRGVLKGTYDHATGRFTSEEWVDPQTCVIFAGLHTLALESQRRAYELSVFLDPDESLRRHWKVLRDHRDRGYTPEQALAKIDQRQGDRDRYIMPQYELAELIVRYRPTGPLDPSSLSAGPRLSLELIASNSFSLGPLADELRARGALEVEHDGFLDTRRQVLAVSGSIDAPAVLALAEALVPSLDGLTHMPTFAADLDGVLQLAFLICLSDKLRWGNAAS